MKQLDDRRTADLFPPGTRPRGRPVGSTPSKTNAERQADYRARRRAAGEKQVAFVLPDDVVEALESFVKFKDETREQVVARILRDRLLRKR